MDFSNGIESIGLPTWIEMEYDGTYPADLIRIEPDDQDADRTKHEKLTYHIEKSDRKQ